jgi:hypothetical protein
MHKNVLIHSYMYPWTIKPKSCVELYIFFYELYYGRDQIPLNQDWYEFLLHNFPHFEVKILFRISLITQSDMVLVYTWCI